MYKFAEPNNKKVLNKTYATYRNNHSLCVTHDTGSNNTYLYEEHLTTMTYFKAVAIGSPTDQNFSKLVRLPLAT